jgi:GMP synthase-like glutamine amidotransferase
MTTVLVLNHRGVSVDALAGAVAEQGATVQVAEPESFGARLPVSGFDGVIASGGYLKAGTHQQTLKKYSRFFEELDRPFLGVCLGMKILGFSYGARLGKTEPVIGDSKVRLRDFPLLPGLSEFRVHENHRYELLRPLPGSLEDFTAPGDPVEAVKVRGRHQYAVQFHPEVGESPARVLFANFLSLCAGTNAESRGQGT